MKDRYFVPIDKSKFNQNLSFYKTNSELAYPRTFFKNGWITKPWMELQSLYDLHRLYKNQCNLRNCILKL